MEKEQKMKRVSNLLLLLTALIWGAAFVAQSVGMEYVGPWTFVCFRYLLSFLVLIPVSVIVHRKGAAQRGGQSREKAASYLRGGLICGAFLGAASITQQIGIQYTTAGKAGFITSLYVVLVPLLGLLLGRRPEKKIWLCVCLGMAGLYLISVREGFAIEGGDAMVMVCALLFAGQILAVDHFSSRLENAVLLSNLQFVTAAVIGCIGMLLFEEPKIQNLLRAAVPILYAGILSGAAGYTLQTVAQKHTEPAVASLLMSLESVFSALAGWMILGQMLSLKELLGCALVFAAVILAQIPAGFLIRRNTSDR